MFFVQESKTSRKNKVKLADYVIFEHLRNNSGGGGLLTAVHKNLDPVSIGNEEDEEVLTVQGNIMNKKVRFINAYGPQENTSDETKFLQLTRRRSKKCSNGWNITMHGTGCKQ